MLAFIGWRLWAHTLKLVLDRHATPVLGMPLAPFGYFMVVLTALAVLLLVLLAWQAVREAGHGPAG